VELLGVGPMEFMLIAILALTLLGPTKLVQSFKGARKELGKLKEMWKESARELSSSVEEATQGISESVSEFSDAGKELASNVKVVNEYENTK
jgi:Sec-independent protein translocase protein TatA